MKKELFCWDCDASFVVSSKDRNDPQYCPFCAAKLQTEEVNDFEDDPDE